MDAAGQALQPVLVLLAGAVLAVVASRSLGLPPIIGYLATGVVLGPHALGLVADTEAVRHLAEFGVVFLMFSIGLEFSLPKLRGMGRAVFGLGLAQVATIMSLCVAMISCLSAHRCSMRCISFRREVCDKCVSGSSMRRTWEASALRSIASKVLMAF
jgi:Kef-type K+ transport system membrane component KefB